MNAAKKRILKTQSKWADAKVEVRSIPQPKGAGMFAKRDIKSGETIAFYPIVMIDDPGQKTKDPLRNYFIEVKYRGKQSKLVGKPDLSAVAKKPSRNIPHTGLWSNEPYPGERKNAEMVGVKLKSVPLVGQKISYSLKSTKAIKKGTEVLWCYGSQFNRGSPPYPTGCD